MKDLIPPCVVFFFCLIGGSYVIMASLESSSELESPATQMNRIEHKVDRLLRHHNLTTEYTKT